MLPAQATLPTDSRSPFHAVAGIQISILMLESMVGLSVAVTRHSAGRLPKLGGGAPGKVGTAPAGNVSCPAGTSSANVMVECGRASLERLSQGAAAARCQASAATRTRYRMCIHHKSPLR